MRLPQRQIIGWRDREQKASARLDAIMNLLVHWPAEFARVIGCTKCTVASDLNLLRDAVENIPQPGYIGSGYYKTRLLLVGQNPGTPKTLAVADLPYTSALRALAHDPTEQRYFELGAVLERFIPTWPVHGNYFPLQQCGLTIRDIAYCNLVRCRTTNDCKPNNVLTLNCISEHFARWLTILSPKALVFIGKWAHDRAQHLVEDLGIPSAFMNRQRSLSSDERLRNRAQVIALTKKYCC